MLAASVAHCRILAEFSFCAFSVVEEGPVFAMCVAGAGDQATLAKWIVGLQETNPLLGQIPVVFRLTPGPRELQSSTDLDDNNEQEATQAQRLTQEY